MSKSTPGCTAKGALAFDACRYPKCKCAIKEDCPADEDALVREKVDQPRRRLSMLTSAERKEYPMASGLLDYFPDALAEVAHLSFLSNQKHNPGQALHWSRGKSNDHADCIMRHMTERGALDPEGNEHLVQNAWRALAELQLHLEKKFGLDPPRGAK